MIIFNNAPTTAASIGMFDEQDGLRRSDCSVRSSSISEMKIAYDALNRTAYGLAHGVPIHAGHSAVIGGFSANPEGAAIVAVAASFQLVTIHKAASFGCRTNDFRIKSKVTRSQLWAAGTAVQGLNRNTRLICDGSNADHPAAGPGTKQYLYESAAGHIMSTVVGAHSTGGTRKFFVSNTCNYGTPLESRWMGEVCKAAVGIDRKQADTIIRYLLDKYEGHLDDPPAGETFECLYDQKTLQPIPEYRRLYAECKAELRQLGMNFMDEEN
jgi:methylamine---corrinoid protein Co-methyltransferase